MDRWILLHVRLVTVNKFAVTVLLWATSIDRLKSPILQDEKEAAPGHVSAVPNLLALKARREAKNIEDPHIHQLCRKDFALLVTTTKIEA